MTMTHTTTQKVGLIAVLTMLFVLMFSTVVPQDVLAVTPPATTTGPSNGTDVDVTMDSTGKVTIKGAGFDRQGDGSAWTNFFKKYRTIIAGVSGIAAITFIAFFIFYFMKLGATAGNPQARSQTLMGLLWTGIAAAGLGSVSIVVGFFYNSLA